MTNKITLDSIAKIMEEYSNMPPLPYGECGSVFALNYLRKAIPDSTTEEPLANLFMLGLTFKVNNELPDNEIRIISPGRPGEQDEVIVFNIGDKNDR